MRTLVQILLILILLGCSRSGASESSKGTKFFSYDEVYHYYVALDEDKIGELLDKQRKSEFDSLKVGVILREIPERMADTTIVVKFQSLGYDRKSIDKSIFGEVDEIFREQEYKDATFSLCMSIYRDILVFKKKNKIVGIAKVCFDCGDSQVIGTAANTENFGQNGDYSRLAKLLGR